MNGAEEARDARIRRLTDVELLDALINDNELTVEERALFTDMRNGIVVDGRACLSKKQRFLAEEIKRRVTPVRAEDAPRGREVQVPEVLRHLPLKPPGRK